MRRPKGSATRACGVLLVLGKTPEDAVISPLEVPRHVGGQLFAGSPVNDHENPPLFGEARVI